MARRSVRSVSTKDCTSPLEVCPFCGGEARAFRCEESGTFDVQCQQCGAIPFIGSRTSEKKTMADVIAAWNTRAAVTDEQFALAVHDGRAWQAVRECRVVGEWKRLSRTQEVKACSCSECGHEFGVSRRNSKPFAYEAPCELPNFCPNCGAKVAPC